MNFKFCGLSSADELAEAHELGATHAGLVVQAPKSHRNLDLETAADLAADAPEGIDTVLVTPTDGAEDVREALGEVPVDAVQATGTIDPSQLRDLADEAGIEAWKGLSLSGDLEACLARVRAFATADAVVLDALSGGYGGSGETIDWSRASEVVDRVQIDVVLAGGLTAHNVGEAIREVDPWGVDVSSGIETDQAKDPDRMQAFAEAVQSEVNP